MKLSHYLTLGFTSLLIVTGLPVEIQANTSTPTSSPSLSQSSTLLMARRKKRPGRGWRVGVRPSRYRVGGFSRSDECPTVAKAVAFVPPPRPEEEVGLQDAPVETTLSSHPIFWVYVSDLPPNAVATFVLQEDWDSSNQQPEQDLYKTEFSLNKATGLLGVRLPKTHPGLKIGEKYTWRLQIQCGESPSNDSDPLVGSWLQRTSPDQMKPATGFDPRPLLRELATAPERDRPGIYAALGLWPDAVTALVELQQKQPKDKELQGEWRTLMRETQMSDFVNVPILGIY